jgi:hypothetical protein
MNLKASALLIALAVSGQLAAANPVHNRAAAPLGPHAEAGEPTAKPHGIKMEKRQASSDEDEGKDELGEDLFHKTTPGEAEAIIDETGMVLPEGMAKEDMIKIVQDAGFSLEDLWPEVDTSDNEVERKRDARSVSKVLT